MTVPRALLLRRGSAAPPGHDRRMRRPTPADATTAKQASASPPLIDRYGPRLLSQVTTVGRLRTRDVSNFRGSITNYLEMRRGEFHYSVIGRHAEDLPAFRHVGNHSLNDEASALNFKFAAAAAKQGFSPVLASRESKKMLHATLAARVSTSARKTHADV
jgi:hypothetical protein